MSIYSVFLLNVGMFFKMQYCIYISINVILMHSNYTFSVTLLRKPQYRKYYENFDFAL